MEVVGEVVHDRHRRQKQILDCLPLHPVIEVGTLSAAVGEDHDGEDRLSALPDDLRRNIIGRLHIKEAARTTALARDWRSIWRSTPLCFYDAHLLPSGSERADIVDHALASCSIVPAGIISAILHSHSGPFKAVHLERCFTRTRTEPAEWSRILATSNVQDLVLVSVHPPDCLAPGPFIRLPMDILRCANVRRLYLGFWNFPPNLPDGIGVFRHLEELGLLDIRMEASDLDRMLASCPKLKKLALVGDETPNRVHLRGRTLQCVLIWNSARVEELWVDDQTLERLIIWSAPYPRPPVQVKISSPSSLKVLGFIGLGVDTLLIGDSILSPIFMIPSVTILALKVDLSVLAEVQLLATFLECFPNIETLHVESYMDDEINLDNHNAEFFEKLRPMQCLRSSIKKVVIHCFRGDLCEEAFLKYISQKVKKLEKLTLVLAEEGNAQAGQDLLIALTIPPWMTKACTILLMGPEVGRGLNFHLSFNLSIEDPFVSEHEQDEVCRFTKMVE